MKIYLVGGAVRDKLLGLPVQERDWVVVGATSQVMLQQGFRKVGRDFPVFLHPKTHEEYALARTERKIGKGYTQFVCHTDPSVTLEDDLKRRDLTINAIAQTPEGKIIDPYGGRKDLANHILRHVSPAFAEDPVRILRLARFAARFGNFTVHPETNKLIHTMTMLKQGEVDALVPERVWLELERALAEQAPERFFETLNNCAVLAKLFPQLVPHLASITIALRNSVTLSNDTQVRFATVTFALTTEQIKYFCQQYRPPKVYQELSLLVTKFKNKLAILTQEPEDKITLLEQIDAYRRPKRLQQLLLTCEAYNKSISQLSEKLSLAYQLSKNVKLSAKTVAQANKKDLPQLLHTKRKKAATI